MFAPVSALLLVLFFVVLGLSVVFVAMRSGSRGPVLDPSKRGSRRTLGILVALAVAVFVFAVPALVAINNGDKADAKAGSVKLTSAQRHGRQVFNRNCVQCHTLAASNSVQQIGPNLDVLRPPKGLVLDAVAKGRARGNGQMPAGLISRPDAEDVASYVARVAGRN